ncbi:MAG: molybdopterin molybdenumtransferase MoeA [Planctomycetota bacterium]|nr:MAG: molybdopterin molybdenumtransferase MoeA [Planctomycetota bacterium]
MQFLADLGATRLDRLRAMRQPSEAIADIVGRVSALGAREHVALADAAGRCLAASYASDVDLPPFEKSMMDGFALRAADAAAGELACVGEARAGAAFARPVPKGACVEIYTGAELPSDCDSVVMIEHVTRAGDRVRVPPQVRPGQNVAHKAEVLAVGREVFAPPRRLSPVDVAVLAAIGVAKPLVFRRPRVAVLTTGDELVPVEARPGPSQIREGNTRFLAAALAACGAELTEVGIVRDDPAELRARFAAALERSDVLVTTGGVSMGKYDLVGAALEALGVAPLLHKVAIKPGKPIWFGLAPSADGAAKPVLGLPGNPVSSLLGFELFVRPVLAVLEGAPANETRERTALGRWMGAPPKPDDRQNNVPVALRAGADGVAELHPLAYKGSADIVALTGAHAFAVFEPGASAATGALVRYRPLPWAHPD